MRYDGSNIKEEFVAILDRGDSSIDDAALAISTNNFLISPVSFEEALAIYAALLGMCDEEHKLVDEALRRKFIHEVQSSAPIIIAQKIRTHTRSIRKILADSVASSLCRQHGALLERIRDAIHSNAVADVLSLADKATLVIPLKD